MNFNHILTNLRHSTYIEFFIGSYVKEKHDPSYNPAIDVDNRPMYVVAGFGTDEDGHSIANLVTVGKHNHQSYSVLEQKTEKLSELELQPSYQALYPQYVYHKDAYWLVVGKIHSLLKAIKLTDTTDNISMELISESVCDHLTLDDMKLLSAMSLSMLLVPLNLSIKPLLSLSISAASTDIDINITQTMNAYAKLNPMDSTQKQISWTIPEADTSKLSLSVNPGDSRICQLSFLSVGTVTVRATSVNNPSIYATLTFNITE